MYPILLKSQEGNEAEITAFVSIIRFKCACGHTAEIVVYQTYDRVFCSYCGRSYKPVKNFKLLET